MDTDLAQPRVPAEVIVFTNGCFDVLHADHVLLLMAARALGDRLVVGLNSDDSVRKLKGDGRPVNPYEDRALVLASLRYVDDVLLMDAMTCSDMLYHVKPQIWVKGGGYTLETLNRGEVVAARNVGCEIRILPSRNRVTSTAILERLRA